MRSSSLILAEAALRLGSIRLAARESRAPPSTVSLALARLEQELAVALARRNTDGLALTLEGRRALAGLAGLAAGLRALQGCRGAAVPERPLTLETLFRVLDIDALPIIVNVLAQGGYVSVLPEHVARTTFAGRHVLLPDAHDQRLMLTWRHSGRSRRIAEMIAAELAEGQRD